MSSVNNFLFIFSLYFKDHVFKIINFPTVINLKRDILNIETERFANAGPQKWAILYPCVIPLVVFTQ